ncbi:phosphoenolpyruvate carboxylase kinase 2, partial [Phtheirospermum japonicum]
SLKRDFQLCEELGRGRFSVVHRCYFAADGESFDCKFIYKHSPSSDPTDRHCLEMEPKIIHLLFGCPSILRLHDAYEDDDYVHIVTDLCDGGNLFERLSSGTRFFESDAAAVLMQLMAAVAYCHRLGVVHRDINEKVDVWSAGFIRMKRNWKPSAPHIIYDVRVVLIT